VSDKNQRGHYEIDENSRVQPTRVSPRVEGHPEDQVRSDEQQAEFASLLEIIDQ